MQDYQLYQQILGIDEPWQVKRVTLNRPAGAVEVEVECLETVWGCPICQQRMQVHDWDRRRWRHLDSCQFQTILVAEVPRVECAAHGTQTVAVPWAEKDSRFTRLFERLAIDVMRECSVAAACEILGMSWDEADGIKQRAVQRGLARKVPRVMPRLCVDFEERRGRPVLHDDRGRGGAGSSGPGRVCGRGSQTREPGRVLDIPERHATKGRGGGGDGSVGAVYAVDDGARAGGCWQGGA